MSDLEFRLKIDPGQRIDLSPLTPDKLAGKNEADIRRLLVNTSGKALQVGEVFDVKIGDAACVRFSGLNARCDRVGDRMISGKIIVDGDVGAYVGTRLQGGEIEVSGNADAFAGASMKKGRIVIKGHAGDYAGGRHVGEMHGIRGGLLHIFGNVGHYAGERMRRGMFVIGGDAGSFAATRMIAGTMIVSGTTGHWPGYGMRRGTLFLRSDDSSLMPTFADCGTFNLGILRILKRELEVLGVGHVLPGERVRRFMGDMASLGKGEILIPE